MNEKESTANKAAKKMGLKHTSFGNYVDKSGQHYTTRGGKLHKVDSKDTKKKEKPSDDVGGPAHPNVPKKDEPKKEPSKPKVTKMDANPFDDKEKDDVKDTVAAVEADKRDYEEAKNNYEQSLSAYKDAKRAGDTESAEEYK